MTTLAAPLEVSFQFGLAKFAHFGQFWTYANGMLESASIFSLELELALPLADPLTFAFTFAFAFAFALQEDKRIPHNTGRMSYLSIARKEIRSRVSRVFR